MPESDRRFEPVAGQKKDSCGRLGHGSLNSKHTGYIHLHLHALEAMRKYWQEY